MSREVLEWDSIHPSARRTVEGFHEDILAEVTAAVARDAIVVVGMAQNPFCKKARKLLQGAGKEFTYLEYGSYLGAWKQRLRIKMWSGWPTLPMVFVKGTLVGGANDLAKLIESGELDELLAA